MRSFSDAPMRRLPPATSVSRVPSPSITVASVLPVGAALIRSFVATLPAALTRAMSLAEKLSAVRTLPSSSSVDSRSRLEKACAELSVPSLSPSVLSSSPAAFAFIVALSSVTAAEPPMPTVPPAAAAAARFDSLRSAVDLTSMSPLTYTSLSRMLADVVLSTLVTEAPAPTPAMPPSAAAPARLSVTTLSLALTSRLAARSSVRSSVRPMPLSITEASVVLPMMPTATAPATPAKPPPAPPTAQVRISVVVPAVTFTAPAVSTVTSSRRARVVLSSRPTAKVPAPATPPTASPPPATRKVEKCCDMTSSEPTSKSACCAEASVVLVNFATEPLPTTATTPPDAPTTTDATPCADSASMSASPFAVMSARRVSPPVTLAMVLRWNTLTSADAPIPAAPMAMDPMKVLP